MTRLRKLLIVISIFMICLPLAVSSQEAMTVTLEQSVEMALERNPSLQIAEKELTKAKASVWEAYTVILPTLDGSASLQHAWDIQQQTIPNFIKQMLGTGFPGVEDMPDYVQLSFGLDNTFMYGLQLGQPLFLGGAGIAGIKMANYAKHASQHSLEMTRQNLIFQSVRSFYTCLLARELVLVQEEALKQAEANLAIAAKKYEAGTASGFDKMRAEVEIANLNPVVIATRNNYQVALTAMRSVLGLSEDVHIDVIGELAFVPDEMAVVELLKVQREALLHRPELLGFAAQKRIARTGITLARSEFFPKVFFATSYSFLAMKNNYKFHKDDFSKGFTSAISLQIPIFRGFGAHKRVQKARLDYKIAEDSEKQIRDGIMAEVEIVYNNFQEARERLESAGESIQLAEEALRLANLMYEEGASTQLDVMSSQLALRQSRLNNATALFEYQVARYNLRRVMGGLKGVL
jgi:outer membrane protein